MIKDFGVEKVKIEGPHADEILHYLVHAITYDQRKELFREARRDGNAHLTYRTGGEYKHATLKRNSDGTYEIED
ncbi:MAG: hypothetical protein AAB871_01815 [Patescibacteria group bacterium]